MRYANANYLPPRMRNGQKTLEFSTPSDIMREGKIRFALFDSERKTLIIGGLR